MRKLLLLNLINISCSGGWSVGGYELTPADTTTNTVFIEIMDKDSTIHYYHDMVYEASNWCWLHQSFEDLKRVNE
jgi:hypothetical protein